MFLRQRLQYEQRCPIALAIYDLVAAGTNEDKQRDFDRVSGLVECPNCGHQYYDHPQHPFEECLTITCSGRIVKL